MRCCFDGWQACGRSYLSKEGSGKGDSGDPKVIWLQDQDIKSGFSRHQLFKYGKLVNPQTITGLESVTSIIQEQAPAINRLHQMMLERTKRSLPLNSNVNQVTSQQSMRYNNSCRNVPSAACHWIADNTLSQSWASQYQWQRDHRHQWRTCTPNTQDTY